MKMKKETIFKIVFSLIKSDTSDFDREAVTRALNISPTENAAPRLSKGRACAKDTIGNENATPGLTFINTGEATSRIMIHASWSVELPPVASLSVDEPLNKLADMLSGKKDEINRLCNDYGLFSDITVTVYSGYDCLPEMCISNKNVSFCASVNASLNFDLILD